MKYRRVWQPGGGYFFTVVTYQRLPVFSSETCISLLKDAFRHVANKRPFVIDAIVILPNHLHCIWQLPEADTDYATRWRLIKHFVTRKIHSNTPDSGLSGTKGKIWQKRYWEHFIRDEIDWQKHIDYIHYNPVKHGYVNSPGEWSYSSFNRAVEKGLYDKNWGTNIGEEILEMELE